MKKYYSIFGLVVLLTLFFIIGCAQKTGVDKGFLEGKITIGPICPVEWFPPDTKCLPTEETYKAWPIIIWTADKKVKIAQIIPNQDGAYRVELSNGNYIVDLKKRQPFGIGSNNLPAAIKINSGGKTSLDINIDTGIR